jgi:hypothetical protein
MGLARPRGPSVAPTNRPSGAGPANSLALPGRTRPWSPSLMRWSGTPWSLRRGRRRPGVGPGHRGGGPPGVRPAAAALGGGRASSRAAALRLRHDHRGEVPRPHPCGGLLWPGVRALVCYLLVHQHLPADRAAQLLSEVLGASVATGTLAAMVTEGAKRLDGFIKVVRARLAAAPVAHLDETGTRVAGRLHWVHSASTDLLSLVTVHPKRGKVAMDAARVLLGFGGVAVHDGWPPYWRYLEVRHQSHADNVGYLRTVNPQVGDAIPRSPDPSHLSYNHEVTGSSPAMPTSWRLTSVFVEPAGCAGQDLASMTPGRRARRRGCGPRVPGKAWTGSRILRLLGSADTGIARYDSGRPDDAGRCWRDERGLRAVRRARRRSRAPCSVARTPRDGVARPLTVAHGGSTRMRGGRRDRDLLSAVRMPHSAGAATGGRGTR